MLKLLMTHAASLLPQPIGGHLGWLRGAIGGAIGIGLAGSLTWLLLPGAGLSALPWLVAPLGASAVLVFAVPASPLAQPWPVLFGNLLSATIGIAAGKSVGVALGLTIPAAGLAVGLAIAAMSLTRSLHPPGGACALLCALGASGPEAWSWLHLLPFALNLVVLAGTGWIYNNLTGHPWPHQVRLPAAAAKRQPYARKDLEAVLAEWNEVIDVDIDELDAIFQAVQRKAERSDNSAKAPEPGQLGGSQAGN